MSTTSHVGVFDYRLYQDLNAKAAGYMREDPQINWLPVHNTPKLNAYEYKKPLYEESIGIKGAHTIGISQRMVETPKAYRVYDLEGVEADIYYDMNDMTMQAEYLAQEKAQEVAAWANQVKQAFFKGVFTEGFTEAGAGQGKRLNNGIIEQATLVQDLDGADSQLIAAGDVYKALDKIVGSIPFHYRDGRQVIVGCDDLFRRKARTALFRGATNQISEFDLFFKELAESNPTGTEPMVQKPLVVSDKLFLNLVAGATKTEADTVGTHSRLFAAVVDPEIIEAAISFYGMVGEKQEPTIRGVEQKWFARLCGCVHRVDAVTYSERITWA